MLTLPNRNFAIILPRNLEGGKNNIINYTNNKKTTRVGVHNSSAAYSFIFHKKPNLRSQLYLLLLCSQLQPSDKGQVSFFLKL
jgi:hypothetical protein